MNSDMFWGLLIMAVSAGALVVAVFEFLKVRQCIMGEWIGEVVMVGCFGGEIVVFRGRYKSQNDAHAAARDKSKQLYKQFIDDGKHLPQNYTIMTEDLGEAVLIYRTGHVNHGRHQGRYHLNPVDTYALGA